MEMTTYSLDELSEEAGDTGVEAQQVVDFGPDAFWRAPTPRHLARSYIPAVGEIWPKEDMELPHPHALDPVSREASEKLDRRSSTVPKPQLEMFLHREKLCVRSDFGVEAASTTCGKRRPRGENTQPRLST